ncbi:MAG: hypothetical protein ACYTEG_05855 [Planctomycetota bacterium]
MSTLRLATPSVQLELNRLADSVRESCDVKNLSLQSLIDDACLARDARRLRRAESLAISALRVRPGHEGALAVLCSVYRRMGRPESALALAEAVQTNHRPLLTTHAAALCDLQRWVEAKRVILRVFRIGGTGEAFAVMHRIKGARPDLFPGGDLAAVRQRPGGDAA